MNQFSETLREINRRLDLPQPAKSRVILEIAADLQDLFEYYRGIGLNDETARERALVQCDLSDESLAQLVQIHTAPWRRFLDRLSDQGRARWERGLLLLLMAFIAATTGRLVISTGLFRIASGAVWPIIGITAAALIISAYTIYLAYIKQEHDLPRLRSGLPLLLVLSGGCLVIGLYGYWLALYRTAARAAADVEGALRLAVAWLTAGSAMLMVAFMSAILIALLWYLLADKVARIEEAEAAVLMIE